MVLAVLSKDCVANDRRSISVNDGISSRGTFRFVPGHLNGLSMPTHVCRMPKVHNRL